MEHTPSDKPMNSRQVISFLAGLLLAGVLSAAPIAAVSVTAGVFDFIPSSLAMFGLSPHAGTVPDAVIGLCSTLMAFLLELVILLPVALWARGRKGWELLSAACTGLLAIAVYGALWSLAALPFPKLVGVTALLRLVAILPFFLWLWFRLHASAPSTPHRLPAGASLLAIGAGLLILLPWMARGALGSGLQTLEAAARAISYGAGEEILLRGVVAALISRACGRRRLGFLFAFAAGMAMQPSYLLPMGDWLELFRLFNALILGLLLTELASRGSIWPAVIAHAAFEFGMPGFADARMQWALPHPAALESLAAVLTLAAAFFLWRRFFGAAWKAPSRALQITAASVFAAAALAASAAGWFAWGHPGFTEDGFLIIFREQADLSGAESIPDRTERMAFVYERLVDTADRVQQPVRAELDSLGVAYRPHYLINLIEVDGRTDLMSRFASRPDVAAVMVNPNVRIVSYTETMANLLPAAVPAGVEWNILDVGADMVWEMGVIGQGIVVAGADTGVDWTHPALQAHYRGWNQGAADHAYNWFDPWDGQTVPWDDHGHGTHTLGTVLGDDGMGNRIGMAPGAEWIACRNMRYGIGNPGKYLSCLEFFLAPFPAGGDPLHDGRPALAAHVVNNSWGCPEREGCAPDTLELAVDHLRMAGIMMVVSAGNSGPGCRTVSDPPANFDSSFTVGAVDSSHALAFFSSRGPFGALIKPDIVAPGVNVLSAIPGGRYGAGSGTSMAGPHVAGLVALLWSADPMLIGDIARTERLIRETARPVPTVGACSNDASRTAPCLCGADIPARIPNNSYGAGLIDAYAALMKLLGGQP